MAVFQLTNFADEHDRKRQAEWRERSVEEIKKSRQHRLKLLGQERVAITRATREYRLLDQGEVPWIGLRSQFIWLDTPRHSTVADDSETQEPKELSSDERSHERHRELATRPPLTRLVHRQSNALSVYLTAVYIAHLEAKPGSAYTNNRHNARAPEGRTGWIWLAGLSAPREIRTRRARIRRALDELVNARLVNIQPPAARYRYESWMLLQEDGSESRYRVPSERDPAAVVLPAAFFLNGWHLVLNQGEIAMLLAIMHMFRRQGGQNWVVLPQSVRRNRYGLSGEIYLHAQQLHEFGLIHFHDPMPARRRGKISNDRLPPPPAPAAGEEDAQKMDQRPPLPVPYWFGPALPAVFDRPALTVVHDTLTAFPVPYRLSDDSDGLWGEPKAPQDLVPTYLQARHAAVTRAGGS